MAEKYVIINECTGDSECSPAGILDDVFYSTRTEARLVMLQAAADFRLEMCEEDDLGDLDGAIPMTLDGEDSVSLDVYGVTHTYTVVAITPAKKVTVKKPAKKK